VHVPRSHTMASSLRIFDSPSENTVFSSFDQLSRKTAA
jgi:hypothetical protein